MCLLQNSSVTNMVSWRGGRALIDVIKPIECLFLTKSLLKRLCAPLYSLSTTFSLCEGTTFPMEDSMTRFLQGGSEMTSLDIKPSVSQWWTFQPPKLWEVTQCSSCKWTKTVIRGIGSGRWMSAVVSAMQQSGKSPCYSEEEKTRGELCCFEDWCRIGALV